jgi:hypothetical protein
MKKIPLIVWVILICLILVHYFYTPEMPEIVTGGMRIDLAPWERQPDLVHLWDALVCEQGFANESAILVQLNQFVDKDGVVQCTQAYYTGDVDGEQHFYEVYAYPSGNVLYKDQVLESHPQGVHPLAVFREATLIDFAQFNQGECNITLKTFKHEIEREYNETHGDLYILSQGSLRPLKEAKFPDGTCWYTIEIIPEVPRSEGSSTAGSVPDRLILFTEQDVALAETVVYT